MSRQQYLEQIGDGFGQLKRAMHIYNGQHMSDLGLSPAQLGILKTIQFYQPVTQKSLAETLQLTPGAISQLVEALSETDCIIRTASSTDKRANYLSVSPDGILILRKYDSRRRDLINHATINVSDKDLENYMKVHQSIIRWLEQANT